MNETSELDHSETGIAMVGESSLAGSLAIILTETICVVTISIGVGFRSANHYDSVWMTLLGSAGLISVFIALVGFELLRVTGLHSFLRGVGSVASVFPVRHVRRTCIPAAAPETCEQALKNDWKHVRADLTHAFEGEGRG